MLFITQSNLHSSIHLLYNRLSSLKGLCNQIGLKDSILYIFVFRKHISLILCIIKTHKVLQNRFPNISMYIYYIPWQKYWYRNSILAVAKMQLRNIPLCSYKIKKALMISRWPSRISWYFINHDTRLLLYRINNRLTCYRAAKISVFANAHCLFSWLRLSDRKEFCKICFIS